MILYICIHEQLYENRTNLRRNQKNFCFFSCRYTEAEIRTGLGPALEEFLHEHEDTWRIARKDENNNGLTVLQRVDA